MTITPRKRQRVTKGYTERVKTGCGHLYVTVNRDEQGLVEVFATLGKTGGCASAQIEGLGRLISLSLRSGEDIGAIVEELRGIRCPSPVWDEGKSTDDLKNMVTSCADAIAKVLAKELPADPIPNNTASVG